MSPFAVRLYLAPMLAIAISSSAWAEMNHEPTSSGGTAAHPSKESADGAPSSYWTETSAAMARMMADMDVKSSGDVDRDFVAMMVPHHQGAIDMAKAVLRYGRNEELRQLARDIIVKQEQEIATMRRAVDGAASGPSPSAPKP